MTPTTLRGGLFAVSVVITSAFAGQSLAESTIYIKNDLSKTLKFVKIKNRQAVTLHSDPPDEIAAGSTGSFDIGFHDGSRHLNIKYQIGLDDGAEQVGVVYKEVDGTTDHCPKEHPDWVTETVTHCGDSNDKNNIAWTYTFDEK